MRINTQGQGYHGISPRTAAMGLEVGLDAALVGTEIYSPGSLPLDYNMAGGAALLHGSAAAGQLFYAGTDDHLTGRDQGKLSMRAATEAARTAGYVMIACGSPFGGAAVVGIGTVADILTSCIKSDAANI